MAFVDGHPETASVPGLASDIRTAGVAGAGGAGFPTYVKWERAGEVDALLVNHQESEPNFLKDRYLGREHAEELASFLEWLQEHLFETIVIGTKAAYRGMWIGPLEERLDAPVLGPEELPIDADETGGIVVASTDDRYEYGMESVLLRTIAGVTIGKDLPLDHGWLVQNTESLYNVGRAITAQEPVTRKLVHVDGDTPRHRFLDVPIGTPATALLREAGRPGGPGDGEILADGGPGWSFEIERDPDRFGVRKRTNCLLVIDETLAAENTLGGGRINILAPEAWKRREFETEPTTVEPSRVRIPLRTNDGLSEIVARAEPIVDPGQRVAVGDRIADPLDDQISIAHHASIDGEVTAVTENHVTIERA